MCARGGGRLDALGDHGTKTVHKVTVPAGPNSDLVRLVGHSLNEGHRALRLVDAVGHLVADGEANFGLPALPWMAAGPRLLLLRAHRCHQRKSRGRKK
jgi:hypothetical protein